MKVWGVGVLEDTRCAHYQSGRDILAILCPCCEKYFACYHCHCALVGAPPLLWPPEQWHRLALLCGGCHTELTIYQYLRAKEKCPCCHREFNPKCRAHWPLYFVCN